MSVGLFKPYIIRLEALYFEFGDRTIVFGSFHHLSKTFFKRDQNGGAKFLHAHFNTLSSLYHGWTDDSFNVLFLAVILDVHTDEIKSTVPIGGI